jgi:hypothetical protein
MPAEFDPAGEVAGWHGWAGVWHKGYVAWG